MDPEKYVHITQKEVVTREEFCYYIKSLRLSRHITIEELSKLMQIDPSMIYRYEKGERVPYDPFSYVEALKEVIKTKRK